MPSLLVPLATTLPSEIIALALVSSAMDLVLSENIMNMKKYFWNILSSMFFLSAIDFLIQL
ncbi:MAG: hypothetical protein VW634_11580, partial [Paracoccaceae bacterium]